ncbi:MAG: hypothetical protein RR320_06495, partial [Oscillospiraceae bacterium]
GCMNLVNGALNLFAALVISMLLLSVYGEKREQPFEKYLAATMFVHLAALLLDACRWFLYAGREPNSTLILCLIAAATVLSLVSSACFVHCLIAYFSERLGLTRNIFPILRVLCALRSRYGCFLAALRRTAAGDRPNDGRGTPIRLELLDRTVSVGAGLRDRRGSAGALPQAAAQA